MNPSVLKNRLSHALRASALQAEAYWTDGGASVSNRVRSFNYRVKGQEGLVILLIGEMSLGEGSLNVLTSCLTISAVTSFPLPGTMPVKSFTPTQPAIEQTNEGATLRVGNSLFSGMSAGR
jgi:hypothetical protein